MDERAAGGGRKRTWEGAETAAGTAEWERLETDEEGAIATATGIVDRTAEEKGAAGAEGASLDEMEENLDGVPEIERRTS